LQFGRRQLQICNTADTKLSWGKMIDCIGPLLGKGGSRRAGEGENRTRAGRISDSQREFQALAERSDCDYTVARSRGFLGRRLV
jgi:hypothetical protein